MGVEIGSGFYNEFVAALVAGLTLGVLSATAAAPVLHRPAVRPRRAWRKFNGAGPRDIAPLTLEDRAKPARNFLFRR